MNAPSRYLGLFASALIGVTTIAPAKALPQLACNGLPISEGRAIIGRSPVFKPGSIKRQDALIISDCGYTSAVRGGQGVLIMLMKSPTNSSLAPYVSVRVAGAEGIDFVQSKNVLAAILQKM